MSPSGPRQAQQDSLKGVFVTGPDPFSVFLDLDPYSVYYGRDLVSSLDRVTSSFWQKVLKELPGRDSKVVLANAWAIALQSPKWTALLYWSVANSDEHEVATEAARLLTATIEAIKHSPEAVAVVDAKQGVLNIPPDLGSRTTLKPGLRLRYALAHHWAKGATLLELLRIVALQPNTSNYLRSREFARALRAGHTLRAPVARLTEAEYLMLSERENAIVMESPEVSEMAVPESLRKRPDLASLALASREEQQATRQKLTTLKAQLLSRSFNEAEAIIAALGEDPISRIIAIEVMRDFATLNQAELSSRRFKYRKLVAAGRMWPHLPIDAVRKLETLVPSLKLPEWWSLSAEQIAQSIATGTLSTPSIHPPDFAWIQASWNDKSHKILAAADRYDALPPEAAAWNRLALGTLLRAATSNRHADEIVQARVRSLPDARPILALLSDPDGPAIKVLVSRSLRRKPQNAGNRSWIDWAVNCIGTSEWNGHARIAGAGTDTAARAIKMLKSGMTPINAEKFRSALVDLLLSKDSRRAADAGTMQEYFSLDPLAADLVAARMPPPRLRALLASPKIALPVLDRFMALVPDSLQKVVWKNQLSRAPTAEHLRCILLERAGLLGEIPWNDRWLKIEGNESDKAVALILACRRDPKRLRQLPATSGEGVFIRAVWEAAASLPTAARRDRGFLELVGALGAHQIPYLSAIMAMADRNAASGHKFDHAYRQYLLPKKSGGSRVISVPHQHLKRIQRAVLDRLLQPLGNHDCAHGFVTGRSIRGNASVHSGQLIVTNADVSNCFPSVKWPLVLGAFRRDLGQRLAPGAISLLVDICTSNGGLPIGAPSSPALLNRVLLRTDEILQKAAARLGCRYSRYADDLTFSGGHGAVKLLGIAKRTLSQIGLALDPEKTNIYRRGRRQMVTGLVVNDSVSVPRRIRRRMRAAVRAVELGRNPYWHGTKEETAALMGRLAFVGSVNPSHAAKLKARLIHALHSSNQDHAD